MPLTTVVLDLGETLVDETSLWQTWAEFLGVPTFTLYGVLGGLVARGQHHTDVLSLLRPDEDRDALLASKDAVLPWRLGVDDLYADAVPCLAVLRAAGWRVVVGGNQPADFEQLVHDLGLAVDLVTSSGSLGAQKPDREFYERIASAAGVPAEQCVHVGDRVDNDVDGALAAGMTAVHLRRGPWGLLFEAPAGVPVIDTLAELPAVLEQLRAGASGSPVQDAGPDATLVDDEAYDAQPDDGVQDDAVQDVVEVWRAAEAGRGRRPSAVRLAQVRALVEGALVVEADGGAAAGKVVDDLLEVVMLAVRPDLQRQGMGTDLLEALADTAWSHGARRLALWAPATAEAFLAECGLEPSGTREERDGEQLERWTAELEAPVEPVVVTGETVRLGQLLKLAGLVDTGTEAKELIAAGEVLVNGEVETRRGRQMEEGDLVVAHDRTVQVLLG